MSVCRVRSEGHDPSTSSHHEKHKLYCSRFVHQQIGPVWSVKITGTRGTVSGGPAPTRSAQAASYVARGGQPLDGTVAEGPGNRPWPRGPQPSLFSSRRRCSIEMDEKDRMKHRTDRSAPRMPEAAIEGRESYRGLRSPGSWTVRSCSRSSGLP